MLDWVAFALALIVYAGFVFGAYRSGNLPGAWLGLGITVAFFWLSLTG